MMEWPYPVGTVVKLSKYGCDLYGISKDNPEGISGVIIHQGNTHSNVRWDNGRVNTYREGSLTPQEF